MFTMLRYCSVPYSRISFAPVLLRGKIGQHRNKTWVDNAGNRRILMRRSGDRRYKDIMNKRTDDNYDNNVQSSEVHTEATSQKLVGEYNKNRENRTS